MGLFIPFSSIFFYFHFFRRDSGVRHLFRNPLPLLFFTTFRGKTLTDTHLSKPCCAEWAVTQLYEKIADIIKTLLLSQNKKIARISGSRLQYTVKESRISCSTASKAREIAELWEKLLKFSIAWCPLRYQL